MTNDELRKEDLGWIGANETSMKADDFSFEVIEWKMKDNILLDKSFAFAVRTVKAYRYLVEEKKEHVISKQFLRSGTSIGANAEEAIGGQSKADFVAKLSIAYKEARETKYWLRLLEATDYLDKLQAKSLLYDIEEILKIIGKIQITTKNKNWSATGSLQGWLLRFVIRNSSFVIDSYFLLTT